MILDIRAKQSIKIILPVSLFCFNVTTRKLKIAFVAHLLFLLHSASCEPQATSFNYIIFENLKTFGLNMASLQWLYDIYVMKTWLYNPPSQLNIQRPCQKHHRSLPDSPYVFLRLDSQMCFLSLRVRFYSKSKSSVSCLGSRPWPGGWERRFAGRGGLEFISVHSALLPILSWFCEFCFWKAKGYHLFFPADNF